MTPLAAIATSSRRQPVSLTQAMRRHDVPGEDYDVFVYARNMFASARRGTMEILRKRERRSFELQPCVDRALAALGRMNNPVVEDQPIVAPVVTVTAATAAVTAVTAPSEQPKLLKDNSRRTQILELLRAKPGIGVQEISAAIGVKYQHTSNTLSHMKSDGLITTERGEKSSRGVKLKYYAHLK